MGSKTEKDFYTVRHRSARGIFCMEGDWWNNLKRRSSVEPVLHLLGQWDPFFTPYIHRDVDTATSFWHYLQKWAGKRYADYPILYLALHGDAGQIYIGDRRRRESTVSLDALSEKLEGRCKGRIIYFGTCATLAVHGNALRGFLSRTGALAVCGYKKPVDWLMATGFDLLVLASLQQNALRADGARAMWRRIRAASGSLVRHLGFRMVIRGGQ